MNESRVQELERGLNNQAQKVLSAVPIEQAWEPKQIHAELARINRHTERSVVDGCLLHLKAIGLVKETKPGHWLRVSARPKAETQPAIKIGPALQRAPAESPPPAPVDPLDELGACAAALRQLACDANSLADRLDAAAIAAEDRVQAHLADSNKLRQLQALLKP